MNLLYDEVEEQLRASVRDLLADRAPSSAVLHRAESDEPYDPALWQSLNAMGCAGLPVPESLGGAGASWRESAVVAEELGRSVAGTPFFGSAVLATSLLLSAGADELVKQLTSGGTTIALAVPFAGSLEPTVRVSGGTASGTVRNVADARTADVLIIPATDGSTFGLYAVEAVTARRDSVTSLDLTRPLCDIALDAAPVQLVASGGLARDALAQAMTTGAALLASEQLGIAEQCLTMTVDYLKARYQFGRQIGSYQALKHRAADLWAAVTQARAVARYAADCVATADADAPVAAALAQAYCGPVAVKAAEECVQLHGGIGFTWEHPAHLYLKRAKADSLALGTASQHRARLAELVNLAAPG